MASDLQKKKRKNGEDNEIVETDLAGDLDGAFSQSEDESEDENENSDADQDEWNLDSEGEEDEEDTSDGDADNGGKDVAVSIDGVDNEEALQKLLNTDGTNAEVGIEEPFVDPERPVEDEVGSNYRVEKDANGGIRYVYDEIDPVYDSDDSDAHGPVNTIGNIPLHYYDGYPHIGYDISGKKIMRPAAGDALDSLLESIEIPKSWTGLTDLETGNPLNLRKDELELIGRVQRGLVPEENYDPYPDFVDWFTNTVEEMPLSAAPEPKRRFLPSKYEAKKIMKLVRAIREGRILPYKPPEEREEEEEEVHFDIWQDEVPREPHVMHIAAPKLRPPGFDMSYNPPPEYLPTEEEKEAWEKADPEERTKEYLPAKYDALRKVPGYETFVKERFERCLDLYLAPRVRKNRLQIDPASLLPRLPRPEELRPFPTVCQTLYRGHEGRVRSLNISPCGNFLGTGGDDGTVRVWDVLTGRELWTCKLATDEVVDCVRWRPGQDAFILAAAAGEQVFLAVPPALVAPGLDQASRVILDAGFGYEANGQRNSETPGKEALAKWSRPGSRLEDQGVLLRIAMRSSVKTISWHRRGDHFCTVSPRGQKSSVVIHTLSSHKSQNPFRKFSGLAQVAHFHPTRPLLFVATQRSIRCYHLQKLELEKVMQPGARWISSFDIHHGGDNVIVGSYDKKLLWHDVDLSTRPYKSMRFHSEALRSVKFHPQYPLFASASDDGTVQVLHGKVVADMMENATIVPLKILKGHKVVDRLGVMELDWHPRHPWLVSCGSDGLCRLYT